MGPPEPTPLPRGILTNSSGVYDEVASYSTLPPDKVHQYWHVYTVTNKKLKDPTARRLENFWWHVWGSDRSKLSGRVLARIFQDISLGPTIVPLRGPPNRWEGPDAAPLTIELIVAHLQRNSEPNGKSAVGSSSSALHPLQVPLILEKKVGNSSTSIAKNTTRFVSPQESAEDDGVESDAPSSGSTLANDFEGVEHAVVSNRANSKASYMFRRPQSPTDSHELASTSSAARQHLVHNGESNLRVRQVRNRGQPEVYSQIKRAGKTPCAGSLAENGHKASSKISTREKLVLGKQSVMRRSQSSNLPDRPGVPSMAKPKRSLFTNAVSSTSNVAAQGTIIDQAGSINNPTQISASKSTKDEVNPHGRPSISPLLEARLTPTQPSSSASLPLGRTKSQLTLLLERAKERSRG